MDIGKKTTLVTIEEFTNNGGILIPGREIYTMDAKDDMEWPIGEYLEWDSTQNCPLVKNNRWKSFPISILNKVMIEVKPIYK